MTRVLLTTVAKENELWLILNWQVVYQSFLIWLDMDGSVEKRKHSNMFEINLNLAFKAFFLVEQEHFYFVCIMSM